MVDLSAYDSRVSCIFHSQRYDRSRSASRVLYCYVVSPTVTRFTELSLVFPRGQSSLLLPGCDDLAPLPLLVGTECCLKQRPFRRG